MEISELDWWIERRDTYKVLSEGAREILPKLKKALNKKIDSDLVELLDRGG